jgi:hypothetical protein
MKILVLIQLLAVKPSKMNKDRRLSPGVVSLLKESAQAGLNSSRANVYYSTGTIGTALDRPIQGGTQLFRQDLQKPEVSHW